MRFDKKGDIPEYLHVSRQTVDRQIKEGRLTVRTHNKIKTIIDKDGSKLEVPDGFYWTLVIDTKLKLVLERAYRNNPTLQDKIEAVYKQHFKESINNQ